jgi:protein-tyrosine phosphatase
MLLLALAGVAHEEIAADYLLSAGRLQARAAAVDEDDEGAMIEAFPAERGTTAGAVIADTLAELDVERWVRAAGMADADVSSLRARLLDPRLR